MAATTDEYAAPACHTPEPAHQREPGGKSSNKRNRDDAADIPVLLSPFPISFGKGGGLLMPLSQSVGRDFI